MFLNFPFVRTLEFENCTFNFWFYENSKSLFFKNCTFNDVFNYNAKPNKSYQSVASVVMFENCVFNSDLTIEDMKEGMSNALILKDCRFAKNSNFRLSNISFLKSVFENNIFEGKVFYENVHFTSANWHNLFFLTDFRNNKVVLTSKAKISQILFGAKMVKMANKSIYSFIKVLKAYKINDCASELETLYLNNMDTTKSKTELEIAMKTKWLNMKQTASVLGISYATLLAMRKEDKASGIIRIPYVGEGKSTRYYAPLVQAYKDRDMQLVHELAKEMEKNKKWIFFNIFSGIAENTIVLKTAKKPQTKKLFFHIQQRKWSPLFIRFCSFIGLKAEMFIKPYGFWILLIHSHFVNLVLFNTEIYQFTPNTLSDILRK